MLTLTPLPSSALRLAVAGGLLLAACLPPGNADQDDPMPERPIEEVLAAHTPEWMELPGVVGTGIGLCDDEPCIRVFLSRPSPEAEEAIPERVEGHRVELVVTGPITPRTPPDTAP